MALWPVNWLFYLPVLPIDYGVEFTYPKACLAVLVADQRGQASLATRAAGHPLAMAARRMMSSVPLLRLASRIQRPADRRQPEVGIPHIDQKRTISPWF